MIIEQPQPTNETAGGASELSTLLGVTEHEAFHRWKTEQDEAGYKQSDIAKLSWQAACKWQREKHAAICEAAPIDGAFLLRDIIRGYDA